MRDLGLSGVSSILNCCAGAHTDVGSLNVIHPTCILSGRGSAIELSLWRLAFGARVGCNLAERGPRMAGSSTVPPPRASEEDPPQSQRTVREVRVALVCYGGVSLAIYMHGITTELLNLVAASTAYADDPSKNPFRRADGDPVDTAEVYWDVLQAMEAGGHGARLAGVAPRVVIDIISGTSAGGINGICLAKALSVGRSQEAVRSLWLDKGDIGQLIGGWRGPRWAERFVLGVRALRRVAGRRPPLRGDQMCVWIESALQGIDDGAPRVRAGDGGPESLVPPLQGLQLFVPVTDFRGLERSMILSDPGVVWDRTHRQVLRFGERSTGPQPVHQLGPEWNHALGFAARATSSFPGAFPPISPAEYDAAVDAHDVRERLEDLFPHHALANGEGDQPGRPPYQSPFVDGGVLDNFPFGLSIDAIRSAPAAGDVDRRLLYIEPDPAEPNGSPPEAGTTQPSDPVAPGLLETVFDSYAGIPRQEPLLEDLLDLAKHNATVQRLRSVIADDFPLVRQVVADAAREEDATFPLDGSPGQREAVRQRVRRGVPDALGLSYATYVRLRLSDVIDGYASVVSAVHKYPPDSNYAWLVRGVLREWARGRGILGPGVGDGAVGSSDPQVELDRQVAFLEGLDLQYQRRRVQFLLAACQWWYRDLREGGTAPDRTALDAAKRSLYGLRADLDAIGVALLKTSGIDQTLVDLFARAVIRDQFDADVRTLVVEEGAQLDALEQATRSALAPLLSAWESKADEVIDDMGRRWPDKPRADLQVRDLGFAVWDGITYPIQSLGGVGERDHVEVVRLSPPDARLLTDVGAERDLEGVKLGHFGAFFSRPGRERDYLWGRLDAVERLIRVLLDDPDTSSLEPLDAAGVEACKRGFHTVLSAEQPNLTNIQDTFPPLRKAAQRVAAPASGGPPEPPPTAAVDGPSI
jgi:patatin-related protein